MVSTTDPLEDWERTKLSSDERRSIVSPMWRLDTAEEKLLTVYVGLSLFDTGTNEMCFNVPSWNPTSRVQSSPPSSKNDIAVTSFLLWWVAWSEKDPSSSIGGAPSPRDSPNVYR